MNQHREVHDLEELLDALAEADGAGDAISVADVQKTLGVRSFGPILLAAGMVAFTPIAAIPGVPTTLAVIIILTASQLLLGRRHIWLPGFLLHRSVNRVRLDQGVRLLRPVARLIDKLIRPRLLWLTSGPAVRFIAGVSIFAALLMPPLELVPFAGGVPASAVSLFGLGLIARDGLLVVLGLGITAGGVFFVSLPLLL